MDHESFDRIARVLHAAGTRRGAFGALLSAGLLGIASTADAASKRRRQKRRLRGQAQPGLRDCPNPGPGKNLANCDFRGQDLRGKNVRGANLSGASFASADAAGANFGGANLGRACLVDADLTGANLRGAQLGGAVFCRTTMPDGSVNDGGCDNGTASCPTCIDMGQPCGGGDAGSCCGLGRCVDGVCARPPTSCAPDTRQWTHRTNFGGSGFGSSQLSVPRGLTVSRDGQAVWVTDADFNRISVWTASGSGWVHQLNFGSRGNGPGQFLNALGMAVSGDGQTAWVADTDNHRISVWVRSGNTWAQQTTFGSLGSDPNRFNTPAGVAVSPDGQIAWVADSRNHRISVWTKAGSGWTNLTTFGSKGSPSGQFDLPSGVAVSADGQTVWVADLGNDRVSVWEKSGSAWAPQATFGSRGSQPNQFNNPFGVAIDEDGQTVWVADIGNDRISVWTRSGSGWTSQATFGSRGSGSTQFRGLTEVAVSPDGQTAWVADRGNARVSVWALACPPA